MNGLRRITQLLGVIAGNGYVGMWSGGQIYRGGLKGFCIPFLNCYACPMAVFSCPIGTLQHFMTIRSVPFMLIGTLCVVGMSVGRMACGWVCPFGLLQDLMYKIPTRKVSIRRPFLKVKYITLILLVIIIPFATGAPWFSKLCPAGTLTAGIPWLVINPLSPQTGQHVITVRMMGMLLLTKLVILGVFLVLFIVSKRPFCRTACPLGAVFSLFNRFSVLQIEVTGCRGCGRCRSSCPVDINICENPKSGECIRCLSCTDCEHVRATVCLGGFGVRTLPKTAEKYHG